MSILRARKACLLLMIALILSVFSSTGGAIAAPGGAPQATPSQRILAGAKDEVRRGVGYREGYEDMHYPGGDVARDHGVCTDVVIRSFRVAGYDLQKLIHEDMKSHFSAYPRNWGLTRPDTNIDHRRVPNQMVFFRRFGKRLPLGTTGAPAATWQPGDVIYWKLNSGLDHCGVVSLTRNKAGLPLVIHNLGRTAEEDVLTAWKITGHFRYPKGR
jgi:uncharacterized protein YijF (DUF1287 family)